MCVMQHISFWFKVLFSTVYSRVISKHQFEQRFQHLFFTMKLTTHVHKICPKNIFSYSPKCIQNGTMKELKLQPIYVSADTFVL